MRCGTGAPAGVLLSPRHLRHLGSDPLIQTNRWWLPPAPASLARVSRDDAGSGGLFRFCQRAFSVRFWVADVAVFVLCTRQNAQKSIREPSKYLEVTSIEAHSVDLSTAWPRRVHPVDEFLLIVKVYVDDVVEALIGEIISYQSQQTKITKVLMDADIGKAYGHRIFRSVSPPSSRRGFLRRQTSHHQTAHFRF